MVDPCGQARRQESIGPALEAAETKDKTMKASVFM
jgi:hypothetical protein